ncbi:MAG: DUF72 domain-containing protein [Methanocellales archaeon]|nr:DUF72 domain-containing protein [Methanocellales archaeon]
MIHIGCCGFPVRKEEYFKKFGLVEVQSTFYKLPEGETAERWRKDAPENFVFTIKGWQLITHMPTSPTYRRAGLSVPDDKKDMYGFFRPTDEVFNAWERTKDVCKILDANIVVLQCPPSFAPTNKNMENMHAFFSAIKRNGMRIAWEPRGKWDDVTIKKLCEKLDLINVVDPFARKPAYEQDITYFRLHGSPPGKRMYHYKYSTKDLKRLAQMCQSYREVYCLFNNIHMLGDALLFQKMVK